MSIFKEFFNGNANKFYTSFRQYINKIIPFTEYLDQIQKLTQECLEADDYFEEIDNKANEIVELLKKCINEFVKILQSKNIDVDEFLDEFSEMLNDKNNYFVTSFNLFFDHSSYRSKDNFFETMKLEKKEKGIKL
jgi:hypothetical protein